MVTTAAEWRRHLNQQQLDHVIQSRQAAKTPSPIASPKSSHDHVSSPIGSPSPERFVGTPEPLAIPVDRFGRSPDPLVSPSPERLTRDPTESRGPSPQRLARDQQESPSPSPQRTASPSPERLAINPRESPQTSRSPDRLARNSQESASALPDPFIAPIQVGGDNTVNDELEDDEDGVYETDDSDVAGEM
jgi:hypothetical protein